MPTHVLDSEAGPWKKNISQAWSRPLRSSCNPSSPPPHLPYPVIKNRNWLLLFNFLSLITEPCMVNSYDQGIELDKKYGLNHNLGHLAWYREKIFVCFIARRWT